MNNQNQKFKGDILIIDDKPENINLLANILKEQGYKVRSVTKGKLGIRGAQTVIPDLILLDIFLPEMNGYEICQVLKSDEKTKNIPIIFISALGDVIDKVKAFSVGGVDYITKPFQIEEVIARVETQLSLQSAKEEIKKLNLELEKTVKWQSEKLEIAQEKLVFMAYHDPLTNLPNRTLFMNKLNQEIEKSNQLDNYNFAVLFLDGDRFKLVNDSLGHLTGDQLLIQVAKRLELCLPPDTTLARLGGDEFTILQENVVDLNQVITLAQLIIEQFNQPFYLKENQIFISFSIGICLGKNYPTAEAILRDTDIAMYKAKARGKGLYQIFDQTMHSQILKVLNLESQLRQGINNNSLTVFYQPIYDLKTQKVVSFEALVRWFHPEMGFISPSDFIPLAEDTGLIIPLGIFILETACQQLKQWQESNLVSIDTTISVNISAKQFGQIDLLNQIDLILAKTQLAASCLKLEITETAIINNIENTLKILQELRQRKIQLSIDDFGTGYSSLSYLYRFPLDTLKIDRSFIDQLEHDQEKQKITATIIDLAHHLNLNLIAEGIETIEQENILNNLQCEYGQGYLFSKPLSKDNIEVFLRSKISALNYKNL